MPVLVGTLIAAALFGTAAYFWYSYQARRTATAFLDEADRRAENEEWRAAAEYLYRYLQLKPDDQRVLIRLAETYDKSTEDRAERLRAINLYFRAVGIAAASQQDNLAAKEPDLRCRLAELLLADGPHKPESFVAAEEEAKKLNADDPEGWRLLALSLYGQLWYSPLATKGSQSNWKSGSIGWEFKQAKATIDKAFARALELNPGNVRLAAILARIYRGDEQLLSNEKQTLTEAQREQLADSVVDQVVTTNRENLAALLALSKRTNAPVDEAFQRARKSRPEDRDLATLNRMELATLNPAPPDEGQLVSHPGPTLSQVARRQFVEWVVGSILSKDDPNSTKANRERKAQQVVDQILSGEQPDLHGDQVEELADHLVDQMVTFNQRYTAALLARYRYRTQFRLPQAADDLQQALEQGPDNLTVLLSAAQHARWEAGQTEPTQRPPDEARQYLQEAKKRYEHIIQHVAPADPRAYLGLGDVFWTQGRTDRAIENWRFGLDHADERHLELNPNLVEAMIFVELNSRLADALIEQGRLDEAKKDPSDDSAKEGPLDVLDRASKKLGPTRLRASVRASLDRLTDLLQAKWLITKGNHLEAIPLLKRVTLAEQNTPSEVRQGVLAWLMLGRAHAELEQWESAGLAFERAAFLQPTNVKPRLTAAAAWARAGQWEKAIRYYERALQLEDTTETWFALAQVRFQRQSGLSQEERDWDLFDEALQEAKKTPRRGKFLPAAWRIALLEGNYLAQRGTEQGRRDQEVPKALSLFHAAEEEYPWSTGLFQRLASDYKRLGALADADRTAAYGLVLTTLRKGDLEEARQQLAKLHEKYPASELLVRQLAELAFEARNVEDAQRWETKLRELEGPNGLYSQYYQARRLLAEAKGPEDPNLVRAGGLQAQIQSRRPAWPVAHLLNGMVLQRRGKLPQAIQAYQEAIRLGERHVSVYKRLIRLLYQVQRFDEAHEYLANLRARVPPSQSLSSLEISLAATQGELDWALELADAAARREPEDPMAQLWLGHMRLANGQTGNAEKAYRKAVQLAAPGDIRALNGLFSFYATSGQLDRARETLQELAKNEELSAIQRASMLGRGYELIGDAEQAETNYRTAADLAPGDLAVEMRLAAFLQQSDPPEAEKILRRILGRAPDTGEARRRLATILASRGGEKQWQEATQLLQPQGTDRDVSNLDRRLRAVLFAQRGGKDNRRKARQLLEELIAGSDEPLDGDRLLLARLYEAEGNPQAARAQYNALVGRPDPNPMHLAMYVDSLLRHNSPGEAAGWLEKLEKAAPDDLGVLRLRARWLHTEGRTSEIGPLVEGLADKLLQRVEKDRRREAQLCLEVGNLYSAVEHYQAAESWYRRLVELVPERYEPLATALARQGRTQDAIHLCAKAARSDRSSRPALTVASTLVSGQPTAEDFRLAEPLLSQAVENHKDSTAILQSLANVRVVQQRVAEAVELYRRVLDLDPRHLVALNNLATLLSEQPGTREEALQYIDRALDIAGPKAALLDTKGMVLVHHGKPVEAVPLLEAAASAPNPDPRYDFHLAVAYHRIGGQIDKVRSTLKKARDGNLEGQILTETDQKLLSQLDEQLGP